METKHNELYEAPTTYVVEVKTEGVICGSVLRNPYGESNNGVDPGSLDGDGVWNW